MKTIKLRKENFDEIIAYSAQIVKNGGIIIYPTDTCYGIGGLYSKMSINKISKIKNRDAEKKYSVILDSHRSIFDLVKISKKAKEIIKKNLPGPFTFIVKDKKGESIGVRLPRHTFSTKLANAIGNPIISTSANISEKPVAYSKIDLKNGLFTSPAINLVDLFIDAGALPLEQPSTVIDIRKIEPIIIRAGSGKLK